MTIANSRELGRIRRHIRIRKKVLGTAQKPRLVVHRSHSNLQAQLINDIDGKTIISCSTLEPSFLEKQKYGGNVKAAALLGEFVADKAKKAGITKLVFDRGGYVYHGRIKAFAEAAKKSGLQF